MLDRRTDISDQIKPTLAGEPPVLGLSRYSILSPFAVRSFRFQWPADLATSWAFEMETIILGWYVLVETGSVLWLTMFGASQYLGTLVAPLFGVASDRLGHRNVLFVMRLSYAVLGALLMALAFANTVTPLLVIVIATLTGLVRPSDLGVRGALVAETMPNERLIGAMSIARTTSDSARVAGALAGAGVFALFGMGPAYVIITCLYVAGALLTLGISKPRRHVSLAMTPDDPQSSSWRDLKAGLSQVWNTPILLAIVWLAFLVNFTAYPLTNGLMPYVVRDVFVLNQTWLGYMVASFAGGALIGSLVLSHAGANVALPRMMIVATLLWYALLLVFAHMPGPLSAVVCLLVAGFMQSFCMVPLSIMLLRAAGEKFRGRVMGVRMMAIYSLPLGLLAAGPLIDWFGFRATASLYAIIGLACTALIALRWRAHLWT
jgi:predicted MFS family arabinose efflux permease